MRAARNRAGDDSAHFAESINLRFDYSRHSAGGRFTCTTARPFVRARHRLRGQPSGRRRRIRTPIRDDPFCTERALPAARNSIFRGSQTPACGHCDNCDGRWSRRGRHSVGRPRGGCARRGENRAQRCSPHARPLRQDPDRPNALRHGAEKITRTALDKLSTFGLLSHLKQNEVGDLIDALIAVAVWNRPSGAFPSPAAADARWTDVMRGRASWLSCRCRPGSSKSSAAASGARHRCHAALQRRRRCGPNDTAAPSEESARESNQSALNGFAAWESNGSPSAPNLADVSSATARCKRFVAR